MVKISAYDFSIYGGLEGSLEQISADTIEDKRGDFYYLVKVRTKKNAISYHNEQLPIIPGHDDDGGYFDGQEDRAGLSFEAHIEGASECPSGKVNA